MDMSQAHPSDRFIEDLRMGDLDSLASDEIVNLIQGGRAWRKASDWFIGERMESLAIM